MTPDRELLELAAKAANGGAWHPLTHEKPWNPLADDGDALRLAVKLRIKVDFQYDGAWAWAAGITAISRHEPFDGDPEYATRRAIVRAAAEIGRNMK